MVGKMYWIFECIHSFRGFNVIHAFFIHFDATSVIGDYLWFRFIMAAGNNITYNYDIFRVLSLYKNCAILTCNSS